MEAQVALVRSALQALYSAFDGTTRKAADSWLQNVRNSSGSWQLCLTMLSRPGLADMEYHFAAHSLRLSCCKVPELLDPGVLQGLAVQLGSLLLGAWERGSMGGAAWPIAGQLSSALAALAVRAVCWDTGALVPQLLSLLAPQVATAMLAELALGGSQPGVAMGLDGGGGGGQGRGAAGPAVLAAAVGAEATAVLAVLQVLTALPEACAARAVSAHPQRKAQVAAALAADATVVSLLRATLAGGRALDAAAAAAAAMAAALDPTTAGSCGTAMVVGGGGGLPRAVALRRAGLQLLQAWVEQLGTAPRGLEHEAELISCLYEALTAADTATLAAECLCGLIATCTALSRDAAADDGYLSDASSSSGVVMAAASGLISGGGAASASAGHQRANWSEAAGFRKPRQGNGGGGRGNRAGDGGGGGGAAAAAAAGSSSSAGAAAAAAASPERQVACALLLQRLLDGLQALLQGAAAVHREQQQQQQQQNQAGAGSSAAAEGAGGAFSFWSDCSDGPALLAVCGVLCSAAGAVLPGALEGEAAAGARFNGLWPQLMVLLGHSNPEVALSCVSFWQDTYLAQLMQAVSTVAGTDLLLPTHGPAAPGQRAHVHQPYHEQQQQQHPTAEAAQAMLHSHLPLLAQLLGGLVARAALGPEAAAVATADARDLPEEVRMVRRELGATMRDLVGLVGLGHVAAFLDRLISEHAAQLGSGVGAAGVGASSAAAAGRTAAPSSSTVSWTRLESSLYAANVALCSGGGGTGVGGGPPVDDAHIASIVAIAAAAVVHPASSLKLAGTALTLVGGLAGWFAEHPAELGQPLGAVRAALGSANEKLARNAATALNRLVVHDGCGAVLLGWYGGWVGGLRALLPGPDVALRHKPAPGVDMSSRELLVASLMRLACGGGNVTAVPSPPPPRPSAPQQQQHPNLAQLQERSCTNSRDLDNSAGSSSYCSWGSSGGPGSGGAGSGGSGGSYLSPYVLLQQLLTPRVLAATAELQRLAAALCAATASGALPAYLQLWRLTCQQQQQQRHNQQLLHQLQHCQQHCPQPCHHHGPRTHGGERLLAHVHAHGAAALGVGQAAAAGAGGGGGSSGAAPPHRAPLCQPGSPQELRALGLAAVTAAQRLGGLASLLLFVPAAGQVQDMGANVPGGRRGPDAKRSASTEAAAAAAASADAVASLVVEVVRVVWPNLMACLESGASGAAVAGVDGTGGGISSMLLETVEGAQLLPATCSLLQGAVMVAASPRGCGAGVVGDPDPPVGIAAVELLSCTVWLLELSHGSPPVPPTEQQLWQQHWPSNLDWPAEPGSFIGGSTRGGGGGHPQRHLLRSLWQGPPLCALQLVLSCLPLCGRILVQQPQLQPQSQLLPQLQSQQQGLTEGQAGAAAAAVAEQAVRAACRVVQSACASLQVPVAFGRSGGEPVLGVGAGSSSSAHISVGSSSSPLHLDTERVLQVLPVLQSLLLNVPQAVAASRELLEVLVASTVICMSCPHDPETCRAVLDFTQLLLATTAFAPTAEATTSSQQTSQGGRCGLGAATAAASSGGSGGLAVLQARCRHTPVLERAYAGIGAQLGAPCVCCLPNAQGLVFSVAAVSAAAAASGDVGGAAAAAASMGTLGAVLVLSLMVAAAGAMPPDLMLPISTCLHSAWRAMGSDRFRAWIRAAAVDLSAPAAAVAAAAAATSAGSSASAAAAVAAAAAAPWTRLKPESLAASLAELWAEECERDVMRFKRALKALCGGKRKGVGGG